MVFTMTCERPAARLGTRFAFALVAALSLSLVAPRAHANPFKDFGHAVKGGAKEVGHAIKDGAKAGGHAVKGAFKGGARTHSGVRAGGHRRGGHGGRHRGHARHRGR